MSLPGYQLHQGQVTIEQATTTVTVQLTKLVTVLFTVNEGATALSNALVTVSPKGAKSSRYQMQQHTNANGQAVLKLPANAEFSYTVLLPSYTTVLSSFTLGEQDLSIEIPLQRKRNNVTFTVTDGYAPPAWGYSRCGRYNGANRHCGRCQIRAATGRPYLSDCACSVRSCGREHYRNRRVQ